MGKRIVSPQMSKKRGGSDKRNQYRKREMRKELPNKAISEKRIGLSTHGIQYKQDQSKRPRREKIFTSVAVKTCPFGGSLVLE